MLRLYVLPLVLALAIGSSGMGQEAPHGKPAASGQPAADVEQPRVAQPAGKQPPGLESGLQHERVIYVPFKKLSDVFEREDSSIVLSYGQFLEMWNRLVQPALQPVKPPVSGVITRADYAGSVKGDLAYLDATLDVEVLGAEWTQLPVQFGDAAIGSSRSEDGAVLLRGVGEGQYEFLVRGQGEHQIKLSLVTGVKSGPEGRSFTMQCPAVGVSNLELEIPERDLAVHITPQRTSELRAEAKDATRVRAVLGSTNQFTVGWQPRSGGSEKAGGLANVTDTIAVDVGDGVVHTQAVFDYQILRGSLTELLVEVPSDQRLLDVQAPGLRDWRTETSGGQQRVKVRLHAPATETVRLELHTEAPISERAFQVGNVRAVGAARESGTVAVRSGEDVGLEFTARESMTRIDAADAPSLLRKPGNTFYKFFTPDHKLSMTASQLKPRVIVESRLWLLMDKTRLATRGDFKYEVSRAGVFSLAFRVPAGLQVDEVRTDSMERFEVAPGAGAQAPATLTVYFTKKLLGKLAVAVAASQPRDKAVGELTLPLLEPLNVTREEGLVAMIAPESLEVKTDAAQLQSARAATPAELAARDFQPQVPAGAALAAAFSFAARPVSITQTIAQRPRRTLAAVATVANVKEDVVQVTTTLHYQVQFAGTDTFRIAVPASVSDRLQIEGEGIKERRKSPGAAKDGTVEWTIVLHSEAIGLRAFTATYDQQISSGDRGASFELRPIKAMDADRETGEIAVHKDRALSVDAKPTGLEEIDPRELSQPAGTAQPHLTYRYYQHPVRLVLGITKHELQDVVRTVIGRAYIEAVVTEDGPITVRARYELKSSERQRLAITLYDPRILGVTVAGQSVAPEKAPAAAGNGPKDKTYFVNVARAGDSDEPFQIAAVFEMPRPEKGLGVVGRLRLALPRFDEGVKFQNVYVRIWAPKDYRLVGDPDGLTSHISVGFWDSRAISEAPDNPDSWFPKDNSPFDFRMDGTTYLFSSLTSPKELAIGYWHIPTMATIASLAVLAAGVVLLWFSLETKVLTVFAGVFAVLFACLFAPSFVQSWLLAGRLGIAGIVALWTVVWLLHVRHTRSFGAWRAGLAASSRSSPAGGAGAADPPGGGIAPSGDSPTDRPGPAAGGAPREQP